jgi:hypothetical protein
MPTSSSPVLALAMLGLGCATVYAPLPPLRDTGPVDASACTECPDTGPVVVHRDAGHDSGPLPDANVDAARFDAGVVDTDAGNPFAITVDGFLSDTAWVDQTPLVATITAEDPFAGDHLDRLFYFRDASYLYLGFEGGLNTGDRVVVYVDLGLTGSDVSLMGLGLEDTTGAVDATLSIPIFGSTEFAPELGWGTATMPNVGSAGGDTIGWRRLASMGGFVLITTGSRSQCSATACETAIALATIGATATSPINLVVRLGRPGVGWSNQTFPTTHSGTPENIDFGIGVPAAL